MKKLMVSLMLAGVMVAAFGFVTTANAQAPTQQPVYGQGGGRGGFGVTSGLTVQNEDVHDLMMEAWSVDLGISVEDLNARLEAGETMSQIVLSTGLSFDEFRALKAEIHASIAEQALAAGYITQAEYDWMIQAAARQANRLAIGTGTGTRGAGMRLADGSGLGTGMGGGMRGSGLNSANCTNLP